MTTAIPKIHQYMQLALTNKASDIIITAGSQPALKINGDIVFIEGAPIITGPMAEKYLLDILTTEQKKLFEETLDLDFSVNMDHLGRFRANIFLNKDGVGMTLRPIPKEVPSFDDLGLPEVIKKLSAFKNGLVIITGATGSGKTTTLAALLQEINDKRKKHIVTVEDPIEFVHTSNKSLVNQREVYNHTQSFYNALKSALREAADVILVGEMRDPETVGLALEAAETGALVFATLHTSGAAKAVDRIIDVFPADKQNQVRSSLALSLKAVVWQELLKRKNKQERVVACEVLINTNAVANMIRKGATHQIPSTMETGASDGMITMEQSLKKLKEEGLV